VAAALWPDLPSAAQPWLLSSRLLFLRLLVLLLVLLVFWDQTWK
jgi:hypothetical protein